MSRYLDLIEAAEPNAPPLPWESEKSERTAEIVPFPDPFERARRRAAGRLRASVELAGRYCPACGFSAWRITDRGDASCYGCELARRGIVPRCARCGRREWRLEDGRRVCRYCEAERRAGIFATSPVAARTPEGPAHAIQPNRGPHGGAV